MMNKQKCKNKVEMWTSKLGKQYRKDEVDFNATKAELDGIRNLPENKRCADCGMQGTVWSSVNLGVFTCMRCGSFHRALGTHISKPKGCTGTYLWSPDEVQRMREIGNAKANKLYGSSEAMSFLPSPDASHDQWPEFFRDKYERRRWAAQVEVPRNCIKATPPSLPKKKEVPTGDLLGLSDHRKGQQPNQDFFAQFDIG
eukprot:CAMPEP_0183703376 /NCGR_PEP_ID=MMETSP0737-20130205/1133_1 /TAXON_ID=385413 /ORGANISM="Thalassiosira miniscula, Strain CCMP1093" /LENGTH=198 /DNA_ID=CAMNT_0025930111 /DNA_START=74 /DNA_END=670 /DNA_ORIENTATION=+